MDEEQVISHFIEFFPDLRSPIAEEQARFPPDPGIRLRAAWDPIFRLVFQPMVSEEPADPSTLHDFFDWLEYSVLRGDKTVINWIDTRILERLGDDLAWVARVRPYMGPMTIKHHRMVQAERGRDDGFADLGPPGTPPFTGFPRLGGAGRP